MVSSYGVNQPGIKQQLRITRISPAGSLDELLCGIELVCFGIVDSQTPHNVRFARVSLQRCIGELYGALKTCRRFAVLSRLLVSVRETSRRNVVRGVERDGMLAALDRAGRVAEAVVAR